jgi:dienelactone hydrolase
LVRQSPETIHESERPLVEALREPLLGALDCAVALQCWFDGRTAEARGDKEAAATAWAAGGTALSGLRALPAPTWPSSADVRLRPLQAVLGEPLYLVTAFVVSWTTDAGVQYGLLMVPQSVPKGHRFPLLVYAHRGQAGIGVDEITWLGEQCRKGYAVMAPGRRGQALADASIESMKPYRSEGQAPDPAGEATDVLTAMQGAAALPAVRPEACALIGLGSGAVAALLAASRSPLPACVAVAEAEHLNPFREYWSRVARRENRWPDWEAFCNLEPAAQLTAMLQRSVAHQAAAIRCPVLLLLPEESAGTLEEEAHRDVVARVTEAGQKALLEIPAGTRHGFTDDLGGAPAREALRRLGQFAYRHVPPDDGKDALSTPPLQPPGLPHGN